MLKLFFGLLVLANFALFALQQGGLFADAREPVRMARQINADSIKLLVTEPASMSASTSSRPLAAACLEVGNFDAADATRFEQRLESLQLPGKFASGSVVEPPRHMVLIPSQGSKDAADRKTAELRRLGISDFFIMPEGEQRWGISLGIFRTEEAAKAHLENLTQKGVHTARLGRFGKADRKAAFQVHAADVATNAGFAKLLAEFPKQESRSCEAPFE